jgi:hypothetical protein
MNGNEHVNHGTPGDYFDENSFKTLYGGVFATWVSTNVIVDIWSALDPKQIGLIIAIIVAFIGFLISERRNLKKLLITPFNGFLIYLTILGGTSFLPPPEVEVRPAGINNETADVRIAPDRSAFTRSWGGDLQLVAEKQRLEGLHQNLVQSQQVLESENRQLTEVNRELVQTTRIYEARIDSTQRLIQQLNIPSIQQNQILRQFQNLPQVQIQPGNLNVHINQ